MRPEVPRRVAEIDPRATPDEADANDLARLKEMLGFVLRAPRRHRTLFLSVFGLTLFAAIVAAIVMPRTYQVDTKIVAQRNLVMPSLGNPRRSVPTDSDAPTRGAVDAILEHDNLVALVNETNLIERWETQRPAILRWKDKALRLVFAPPSDDDRLRALVGLLERRMMVQADDSAIKITLQWSDPGVAFDVVSLAEKRFLDRRAAVETSVITETMSILEAEAAKDRDELAAALVEAERVAAKVAPAQPAVIATGPKTKTVLVAKPPAPDPDATKAAAEAKALAQALADKRNEIRAVEEPWQRHLADLRAKLADLRQTYADAHPLVMTLQREIDEASKFPAELAMLRSEEQALLGQMEQLPTVVAEKAVKQAQGSAVVEEPSTSSASALAPFLVHDDPPELVEARAKLQAASRKYEELEDRIDAARIELETARAAFKYRYRVVQPPELPKKALKPNVLLLCVGGSVLGLMLALFAAVARDFGRGTFVETARVRRRLKIPLLAEVNEP